MPVNTIVPYMHLRTYSEPNVWSGAQPCNNNCVIKNYCNTAYFSHLTESEIAGRRLKMHFHAFENAINHCLAR